jgi:dihydroorotase
VTLALLVALAALSPAPAAAAAIELVLEGGRVMDPETGLDAVRHVGIAGGAIVAVSETPLRGERTLDARGLVVSPGFIDLHAHGQDAVSNRLQARDGVTTALEMEIGVFPVAEWLASREGKALLHYGATASHIGARIKLFQGLDIGSWALGDESNPARVRVMHETDYAHRAATPLDVERIAALMSQGLREGGLGLGLGITYTPAASREEILRLFELAAERQVPVYVHLRGAGPDGPLAGFQECLANAAATGASLHIVHLNSSADESARTALAMIRGTRARGVDVTTEAYPYTAGSTRIESALFDSWEGNPHADFGQLQWPLTGERLSRDSFLRLRKQGGWVIIHGRSEATNEWITAQPDVIVASDGIPFFDGPAHPRGAGTFSRVLGHYVREKNSLTLMQALRKMTILPAQRLEKAAPQMAKKGRLQVGADADITVFDPAAIRDRSSYERGDLPSAGIVHVLVAGSFVVRDSELVEGVYPGRPIRSTPP